jgi:hypothetical protein
LFAECLLQNTVPAIRRVPAAIRKAIPFSRRCRVKTVIHAVIAFFERWLHDTIAANADIHRRRRRKILSVDGTGKKKTDGQKRSSDDYEKSFGQRHGLFKDPRRD